MAASPAIVERTITQLDKFLTFSELAEMIGDSTVSDLYLFSDKERRAEITAKDLESNKSLDQKLKRIEFQRDYAVHLSDGRKALVYCGSDTEHPISEDEFLRHLEESDIKRLTYQDLTSEELSQMNYPPECIIFAVWDSGNKKYSTLSEKEREKVLAIHTLVTGGLF